jgi:hypothetical protein
MQVSRMDYILLYRYLERTMFVMQVSRMDYILLYRYLEQTIFCYTDI